MQMQIEVTEVSACPEMSVNPDTAASVLNIPRTAVYAMLKSGALPSLKIGKRRLIRVATIDETLRKLEAGELVVDTTSPTPGGSM